MQKLYKRKTRIQDNVHTITVNTCLTKKTWFHTNEECFIVNK